MPEKILS